MERAIVLPAMRQDKFPGRMPNINMTEAVLFMRSLVRVNDVCMYGDRYFLTINFVTIRGCPRHLKDMNMNAVFVVSRKGHDLGSFDNQGIMLLLYLDTVSSIGQEYGLRRLDECVYISDVDKLELLGETGMSPEQITQILSPSWITASEGLELVDAYTEKLNSHHSINDGTRVGVLQELARFRLIFQAMAECHDDWRFECVM